jgi:hypothetical protein
MASQKHSQPLSNDPGLAFEDLREADLAVDELQLLRMSAYEDGGNLVRGTRDVKIAQELCDKKLLERCPDTSRLVVRCTDAGARCCRYISMTSMYEIRRRIEKLIDDGEITWAETMIFILMHRLLIDVSHYSSDMYEKMNSQVAFCRNALYAAKKRSEHDALILKKHRGRIVEALLEDSLLNVREKHHPETLLRRDANGLPFYAEFEDDEDEP